MRFNTLPDWLAWQETLHFRAIDPGLERVAAVWARLNDHQLLPCRVVTVAGTNGKGSSVALLSSVLQASGYHVGSYTSPHLLRYNERIVINGQPATDDEICAAFARIDAARQDISLTYFEFATLAAALIFADRGVDIAVLEVGMGGRLDAVNLFDADVALITPIGLDHTLWLGDDRETIGFEKAGILREHQVLVCSELTPPQSVLKRARDLQVHIYRAGQDFQIAEATDKNWLWQSGEHTLQLPYPALQGRYQLDNAAAAVQVLQLLKTQGMQQITPQAISQGLVQVQLAGRFQVIPGDITRVFDVTHNQQGAENLALLLSEQAIDGRTYAVVGMLKDKDADAVFRTLNGQIDHWFCGGLGGDRGLAGQALGDSVRQALGATQLVSVAETVESAYVQAVTAAQKGDRLLIFGSFHTIEAVMRSLPEFDAEQCRLIAAN